MLRRFIVSMCIALVASVLNGTTAQPALAQTRITVAPAAGLPNIQGKYRGGSNGIGNGCTLGAERCQVGLLLDFSKTPAGQLQVAFYRGAGTAFYEAMKDGQPYAKEDKMENKGVLPVVLAKDGTFGFSYNYDGDTYYYDQCSLPQTGALRCYFHKKLGSSKNWLVFYQR